MSHCNAIPNIVYVKFPLTCKHKGCTEKAHHYSLDRGSMCDDHFLEFVKAGGLADAIIDISERLP